MTAAKPINRHASAIVVGSTGIMLSGPSGAGKSELALSLIHSAQLQGLYCALIADDQVLISCASGKVIANTPPAIAGLIEIRGSGIAKIGCIKQAIIDFVVTPVDTHTADRLPPFGSQYEIAKGVILPQIFLRWPAADPFAKLAALCPELATGRPARPLHDCNLT